MGEPRQHLREASHRREEEDVSWLDFLRSAGNAVQASDRSTSADSRKRGRADTEPEARDAPGTESRRSEARRAVSGMSSSGGDVGASRDTAIDLSTPPRPRPIAPVLARGDGGRNSVGSGSGSTGGRRGSDMVLPKWQSDYQVTKCPVCNVGFGFWNRKHHCRKCGRVVCAACSPHRITIPRQYIVQPPNLLESDFGVAIIPESPTTRSLGGGEIVRVCNPCVPDPWTPDTAARGGDGNEVPARPLVENVQSAVVEGPPPRQRSERYRYIPPAPPTGSRNRSQSYQPATAPFSRSIPHVHPNAGLYGRHNSIAALPPPIPASLSRPPAHRYSQSSSSTHPLPSIPNFREVALPPVLSAPPQSRPRRKVKEEDECPVCGTELPPGDQLRETHVEQCIAERFSSGSAPSRPPAPLQHLPTPSGIDPRHHPRRSSSIAVPPTIASGSTPPSASSPTLTTTTRPRTTSYRPRGMALYRASEKDCIDEDGEPQECVICFEEFQPGDEMGRMECLCKFHRACIRGWWERRGAGACPTHQLHE